MGLVVDTSAFVELERAESPRDLIEGLRDPLVMPAIVLAELLVGVQLATTRARAARRQAQVDAFRARAPVVDFGPTHAARWAELFASLRRAGRMIPASDLSVAVAALSIGWDVLVGRRDEARFRLVPGLGVRTLQP